jgi:hypothetical protein
MAAAAAGIAGWAIAPTGGAGLTESPGISTSVSLSVHRSVTTASFGATLSAGPPAAVALGRPLPGPCRACPGVPRSRARTAAPLVLAVGLVLGAVLLAPEQPHDQEAICHRHNGVAACRVW